MTILKQGTPKLWYFDCPTCGTIWSASRSEVAIYNHLVHCTCPNYVTNNCIIEDTKEYNDILWKIQEIQTTPKEPCPMKYKHP